MSLKRELLAELGIEDKETIDKIMSAHGAGVESAKATAKAEYDTLKSQLDKQNEEFETLKKASETSADTKKALDDLQVKFDTFKTEKDSELASIQKQNAIALALKDTDTLDSDLLFGQLNLEKVIVQDDGKLSGLDDQVASLKEAKPFLFRQEPDPTPEPTGKITIGGNPNPNVKTDSDPFQNIISNYK